MMQNQDKFHLVEGCRPCNFVCSCCQNQYYRCSTGELMYIWENRWTKETYSILCGECYQTCPQDPYAQCNLEHEFSHSAEMEQNIS